MVAVKCELVLGVVVALAIFAAASARDSEQWDISPALVAGLAKDEGHETLTINAYNSLTDAQKKTLNLDKLKEGVVYNDMPDKNGKNVGVFEFLSQFYAAEKAGGGKSNTAVGRSHTGCNQHWHAMCPVSLAVVKHPDGTTQQAYVVLNNTDVARLITNQAKKWWREAFYTANRKPNTDEDAPIGHIVHMIQDSYAPAHTLRSADGPEGCGPIVLYQGYTMQASNDNHGSSDHTPGGSGWQFWKKSSNEARRKVLFNCAQSATKKLLELWSACKASLKTAGQIDIDKDNSAFANGPCNFDKSVKGDLRDAIFQSVQGEFQNQPAGGSVWLYSTFYGEDADKMKEKLAKAPNDILRRTVKIKYTNPNKEGTPFDECLTDHKDGTCDVEIHDVAYNFNLHDKASKRPLGYAYNQLAEDEDYVGHLCEGQLTIDEAKAMSSQVNRSGALSNMKNAIKGTGALKAIAGKVNQKPQKAQTAPAA